MKFAAIAAAAMITASAASAADFAVAGQTISIGGEVDANYTTGLDTWAMDLTPSAGINAYGVDLTAKTTFNLLDLNTDADMFQGVELEAGYTLGGGLRAYGEIGTDADLEFGDATVGVNFAF